MLYTYSRTLVFGPLRTYYHVNSVLATCYLYPLDFEGLRALFTVTLKVFVIHVLVFILSLQTGATPLFIASKNGHSQVAELLLCKGADVSLPKQV